MNKAELISKIAEKSDLTKKDAEAALNAFMDTVIETLTNQEKIQLVGFGTFETRERAARTGRNPRNPEQTIEIPGSIGVAFRAGSQLKDSVNQVK